MDGSPASALPYVDEHHVDVAASPERVWRALEAVMGAPSRPGSPAAARLLGCRETDVTGPRLGAVGSTIPGFRVTEADPPRRLVLEGRHRFSRYALAFRLEPGDDGGTRLGAQTRAAFPGAAGHVYRAAVIGTRGHVVAVRRMLRAVARRAERAG